MTSRVVREITDDIVKRLSSKRKIKFPREKFKKEKHVVRGDILFTRDVFGDWTAKIERPIGKIRTTNLTEEWAKTLMENLK